MYLFTEDGVSHPLSTTARAGSHISSFWIHSFQVTYRTLLFSSLFFCFMFVFSVPEMWSFWTPCQTLGVVGQQPFSMSCVHLSVVGAHKMRRPLSSGWSEKKESQIPQQYMGLPVCESRTGEGFAHDGNLSMCLLFVIVLRQGCIQCSFRKLSIALIQKNDTNYKVRIREKQQREGLELAKQDIERKVAKADRTARVEPLIRLWASW